MDTLGQMFCPLPFLGVVGKGLWAQWEWGSDPSAAGSSQLRDLELELSGSAPVFSHSVACILVGWVCGLLLTQTAPLSRLLWALQGCCLLAASSVLRRLLALSPQQQPSSPKSSSFLLAC